MPLTVSLARPDARPLATPLFVVALGADQPIPPALADLDAALGGALARTLARRDFRGARDETLHVGGAAGEGAVERVLLVGTGKAADRGIALRRAAAVAARFANKLGVAELAFYAEDADAAAVEAIVVGLDMGAWKYDELRTQPPERDRRASLERATVVAADDAESGRESGVALAHGYALARRLAMMPGNVCTPEYLAQTAREIGERHGVEVSVMGRAEMETEGMGSFLSVALATPQDPQLITLQYRGGGDTAPLALVGKGLCFDTGGISIKPAERMELMKFDMCGAAGVLGAFEAIARLRLPVNVVGVIGATTNMPSGTAVKPGDVVRAMSGKTIEIINTDAEGRLVLADCLTYVKRFKPQAVVDAATLTGAVVIALGHAAVGVFGSDAALVEEVLAAGKRASEPGWELPLWDEYRELIKSDVADIKNTGGRAAGSITAGWFLREFVDDFPWVHLDIAGTAYSETDLVSLPKGPTGTPVGTFVEFVRGRAR